METCHTSHIRRCVEEILLRAFAIETDRNEIAFILFHHQLEIVVREVILSLESGILKETILEMQSMFWIRIL